MDHFALLTPHEQPVETVLQTHEQPVETVLQIGQELKGMFNFSP